MSAARPYFRPILFDFDGTVADTHPGIVQALALSLAEEGLPALEAHRVHPLTGRGVQELVAGALAELTGDRSATDRVHRLADAYRLHYTRLCADGSALYAGMDSLLRALPAPLALLTNKPRPFTTLILDHLGLADRFDVVVAGDDPGAERKPSPWGIEQALARLGCGAEGALFVGDSVSDAAAGVAAGVATCVVAWGYGGERALAEATFQADTVDRLAALLWHGP